jgi:hypothetical protein
MKASNLGALLLLVLAGAAAFATRGMGEGPVLLWLIGGAASNLFFNYVTDAVGASVRPSGLNQTSMATESAALARNLVMWCVCIMIAVQAMALVKAMYWAIKNTGLSQFELFVLDGLLILILLYAPVAGGISGWRTFVHLRRILDRKAGYRTIYVLLEAAVGAGTALVLGRLVVAALTVEIG